MKTVDALFQEHKTKHLSLDDEAICKRYFGLKPETARRYASEGKLGVKARQVRPANGAPWFVDIEDLAKALDGRR